MKFISPTQDSPKARLVLAFTMAPRLSCWSSRKESGHRGLTQLIDRVLPGATPNRAHNLHTTIGSKPGRRRSRKWTTDRPSVGNSAQLVANVSRPDATDTSDTVFAESAANWRNSRNCVRSPDSLVTRSNTRYYRESVVFIGACA